MDVRGKRFVVIGGAGLIGSHTVDALVREDVAEIVVFDNFQRGTRQNLEIACKDPRVKVFEVGGDIGQTDVLDKALKKVDGVFHFAALWLLHCQDFPRSAFDVNIQGTFNVLDACVANGVQRLVYSSSASVYGDAVEEPMTEDHPFDNTTFYGATKIAGEAMARAYHRRFGLPFVGLRYFNVYGPRQDYQGAYIAVIMKMLDNLDRGTPPTVHGDGGQTYDFIYVDDCAAANLGAMKGDTTDRFYNVCTGKRTSIKELAEMILAITGSNLAIDYQPAGRTFVQDRIGCPKRAAKEIGFAARVGLEDGLRRLIEWRAGHQSAVESSRRRGPA
ncbi:MAG: NAD-dependent epimerase/dehydratase family protein [Rhodospirillales bacterium]|nr:NAD-dependent epimerase/dehydratase family protein [Rhodospirillales bacterium]MDP6883795.1 NAD-dependent epimerase/dehydratase family protein [Rhodospirillales bacterium]